MLTMSVQPIDRDLQIVINDNLSPAAQSAILADAAREARDDAIETNREALDREVPYVTTVDGVVGASEDRVQPQGEINYRFELMQGAFAWIRDQLMQHSPVKTGRYEHSHILLVDGEQGDPDNPPAEFKEAIFVSTVPYSRKIERADGVYQAVAVLAAGRFGNLASISFAYRPAPSGAIAEWAKTTELKHGRKAHDIQWLTSQPAVVISMQ